MSVADLSPPRSDRGAEVSPTSLPPGWRGAWTCRRPPSPPGRRDVRTCRRPPSPPVGARRGCVADLPPPRSEGRTDVLPTSIGAAFGPAAPGALRRHPTFIAAVAFRAVRGPRRPGRGLVQSGPPNEWPCGRRGETGPGLPTTSPAGPSRRWGRRLSARGPSSGWSGRRSGSRRWCPSRTCSRVRRSSTRPPQSAAHRRDSRGA